MLNCIINERLSNYFRMKSVSVYEICVKTIQFPIQSNNTHTSAMHTPKQA